MKQLSNALWSAITPKRSNSSLIPILQKISIFEGLNNKELNFVARILHQRHYHPKELIFREGEAGNGMYIIHHGTVVIYSEESQTEYAKLTEGLFFGELSLVDGAPRSASAKCSRDTELFGLFKPDLFKIIDQNPKAGTKILLNLSKVLSERLRNTSAQWLDLAQKAETK